MLDALLSIPAIFGAIIVMGSAVAAGLLTYYMSYTLISRYQPETLKEMSRFLFQLMGVLLGLLLSLLFRDVISELNEIDRVVEGEAVAIADTYHNLKHFGNDEANDIQMLLVEYSRSVIEDDWPALKNDRLGEQAESLLRKLETAVLNLKARNEIQKILWSRIVADVDKISEYRLARLQQSVTQTPVILLVVSLGFLLTMVFFGLYQPGGLVIVMMSLYMLFIGLVIYLILAYSDPFQGMPGVDTAPFEYVIERMQAEIS
jgi:uncharacterized membrane protein YheB (UPF0754 family)